MSAVKFKKEFNIGEVLSWIGGLFALGIIVGVFHGDVEAAKLDIEKNKHAIEKIADLREMVAKLKVKQEYQNEKIDLLVSMIKQQNNVR